MNNDLISKSHFDKRVREAVGMTIAELTADFKDGVRTTLELLKTEPTMDAVQVVRCVECRYYAADKDRPPRGFCMPLHINTVEDWFCADGERREV